MRSFSSSLLLALSLPFYVMANRNRPRTGHDSGPALHARARDHVLQKRISGGRMTYYEIRGAQVACGGYYQPSDFVVALNAPQFGDVYPGPNCGKYITIKALGHTTTAQVVDKCPGCPYGGLDLTEDLFKYFTSTDAGVFSADWEWANGSPSKTTTTSYTTHHSSTYDNPPSTTPHSTHTAHTTSSSSSSSTSTSTTPKSHSSPRTYSSSTTSSSTSRSSPYTTGVPSSNGTIDGLAQPVGTIDGQSLGNLYYMNEVMVGFALILKSFDT